MPISVKNLANFATNNPIPFREEVGIGLNSLQIILFTIMALVLQNLTSVHPETASFGPGRRFRFFAILEIVTLCLRLQKRSGLALNQNLPFPKGHSVHPETASFGPGRRFRFFAILEIVTLCLRLQKRSGLALNQKLPFPDGH